MQQWDPRLRKFDTELFQQEQFSQNSAFYKVEDFFLGDKILGQKLNSWVWSDNENSIYIFKQSEQDSSVASKSNLQIVDVLEGIKLTHIPDPETGEFMTQIDSIVLIPKHVINSGFITRFYSHKFDLFSYLAFNFEVIFTIF